MSHPSNERLFLQLLQMMVPVLEALESHGPSAGWEEKLSGNATGLKAGMLTRKEGG